ncbi:MAG: hypothetical protein Q8920_10265 [Bacillota bacterium]|nr:hypothetical protein [Bacillota bacterium]
MLKKICLFIISVIVLLFSVSCSINGNVTGKYISALINTESASSFRETDKFTMDFDFSKASEQVKSDFAKLKSITANVDRVVDNKNRKEMMDQFINAGQMVLNTRVYVVNRNIYMSSLDNSGKYFKLNIPDNVSSKTSDDSKINDSEFRKKIADIWNNYVKDEIIANEGSSIENTADGDIKVTCLSIQITEDKAKALLTKLAQVVYQDESLKKEIVNSSKLYASKGSADNVAEATTKWLNNLPQNMEKLKDKFTIENLKVTAKIDRDSYIISENIEGTLVIKNKGEIRIKFNVSTVRSDINTGKVKVVIPDMSKAEPINPDSNNPSDFTNFKAIKELFRNK